MTDSKARKPSKVPNTDYVQNIRTSAKSLNPELKELVMNLRLLHRSPPKEKKERSQVSKVNK